MNPRGRVTSDGPGFGQNPRIKGNLGSLRDFPNLGMGEWFLFLLFSKAPQSQDPKRCH